MWQSLQPRHCIVWQWRFYPIRKTCKKWKMTLSSSMTMYSVMHDIHNARRVPVERGWVALYTHATGTFSNQLTFNSIQWAFENGLPFFIRTVYTCNNVQGGVVLSPLSNLKIQDGVQNGRHRCQKKKKDTSNLFGISCHRSTIIGSYNIICILVQPNQIQE